MKQVRFYFDDISFPLKKRRILSSFINEVIERSGKRVGDLIYVFTTDLKVQEINIRFLKHDTLTDIITFNNNQAEYISGEIYISVERVIENSKIFLEPVEKELLRVIFHGVLHLLGFNDKRKLEKSNMRTAENALIAEFLELKSNVSRETFKEGG
jgi:rRNA maturation RNase YbeY